MTTATKPFIHYPRPARVPARAAYAWQRRFSDSDHDSHGLQLANGNTRAEVLRDARGDVAFLSLEARLDCALMRHEVTLTPHELRELAARLIDAAADIELLPAVELQALADAFANNNNNNSATQQAEAA